MVETIWLKKNKKQRNSSGSFKNVLNKMYLQIIYLIYIYIEHLALFNVKVNKTQPFVCV